MKRALAWTIDAAGKPAALSAGHVDLEKLLEDWIDSDVTIAADDVLLIGRQLDTTWKTTLDLLGIDADGNLVVLELKRSQTLRETIAQGLEYAAWASTLGHDDVIAHGIKRYGTEQAFRDAFGEKFGRQLPDELNRNQRVLLVAPTVDDTTALVVDYLFRKHGLPINAVSFDIFGANGQQLIVRQQVVDEASVATPHPRNPKSSRTSEQFLVLADENGVREIVDQLLTLSDILPSRAFYVTSFALRGRTLDKRYVSGFGLYPSAETNQGCVDLSISYANLGALYGYPVAAAENWVEKLVEIVAIVPSPWVGWARVRISTLDQAVAFTNRFRDFAAAGDRSFVVGGSLVPESATDS